MPLKDVTKIENSTAEGDIVGRDKTTNHNTINNNITVIKEMRIEQSVDKSEVHLSHDGRKLAHKLFSKIKSRGRFRGYDQTQTEKRLIVEIKDTIVSSGKEITLEEIVFPVNESAFTHSVSLCGRGGSGKTHQFITLIDGILNGIAAESGNNQLERVQKYPNIIPFYLELNKVLESNDNCILNCLSKDMKIEIQTLESILNIDRENVIIFADGMNEVTDRVLRKKIFNSICDIREEYHTRIVLSSRDDHSGLFNSCGRGKNQEFVKAEVQNLTEKQINAYFYLLKLHVRYEDVPIATRPLLQTAQGLSMYAEMIQDDSSRTLQFTKLGELLQSYCDRIMVIDRDDQTTDLSFEKTLMLIAYHMVRMGKFLVEAKDLKFIIDDYALNQLKTDKKASLIFTNHSRDSYEFTHHNFRDYYAGFFLSRVIINLSKDNLEGQLNKYLNNDDVTSNLEILSLCSDFLNLKQIQSAIDLLKTYHIENHSFFLSVLIKLYSLANGNDISSLNLDNLDLRSVSLSDYKLYYRDVARNKTISISLNNAKISEDTFLQNALQTASSTICSYIYNQKEYVTAFSTTNALIYDVKDNLWKCVRNLPNNGWVNCCCVIEMHNQPCVLLGCRNGTLNSFYPSDNTVETFCSSIDEKNEIDSICCVQGINHNSIIIFSDSAGNVFIRSKYAQNSLKPQLIHSFDTTYRDSVNLRYKEQSLSVTSRLTASEEYVYLCFGNQIWRCALPIQDVSSFEMIVSLDSNSLIKDIYYTEEKLFLNKGHEISIIDCDTCIEGISYTLEKKGLRHFTKFSPDINKNAVIVGVAAKDNDYSQLANFYRISTDFDEDEEVYRCIGNEIPRGLQTLITYTGVYFNIPQSNIPRLATVSDDRSVQILTPDDEGVLTIYHRGSYNGVHSIDIVSDNELLIAQYDGAISYWKKNKKGWRCRDVFRIHSGWVWKVQHYKIKDDLYFISCSYDGTLKCTNAKTGCSNTLIYDRSHKPILEFAITFDNANKMDSVYAITDKSLYLWHNGTLKQYEFNLEKNWTEYNFRSVAILEKDKPYIAVNIKLLNGKSQSVIISWSINLTFKHEIDVESTCDYVRCLKIYDFSRFKLMVIGGNHDNEQYFSIYLFNEGNLEYKGSFALDDRDILNHPTFISDGRTYQGNSNVDCFNTSKHGAVNDIFVQCNTETDKDEKYSFILYAVYKDGTMACYNVTVEAHKTNISDAYHPCSTVGSQPMCISGTNSIVVIGLLDGDVIIIDNGKYPTDIHFHTYANLTTSVAVKLKNADLGSDTQKEAFKKNFAGYFNFDF